MSPTSSAPTGVVAAMTAAARELIAAVPDARRDALCVSFDDPTRRAWDYTPGRRSGVSLAEMDRAAGKAVHNEQRQPCAFGVARPRRRFRRTAAAVI